MIHRSPCRHTPGAHAATPPHAGSPRHHHAVTGTVPRPYAPTPRHGRSSWVPSGARAPLSPRRHHKPTPPPRRHRDRAASPPRRRKRAAPPTSRPDAPTPRHGKASWLPSVPLRCLPGLVLFLADLCLKYVFCSLITLIKKPKAFDMATTIISSGGKV
jgi:hypothetical protein